VKEFVDNEENKYGFEEEEKEGVTVG